MELWKPVPGYEGAYEVSTLGRVRSLDRNVIYRNGRNKDWRGQILKPSMTGSGYPGIELCRKGGGRTVLIHVLVAAAFIGPRPRGSHVAHYDGDKSNPKLSNIRYATPSENAADKVRHGKTAHGERNGLAKLTDANVLAIRLRLKAGDRGNAIAKDFGVTPANISQIKLFNTWPHL